MNVIITRINHIEHKNIIWILAITETLHNLAEAIWLPQWLQTIRIWHISVGSFDFRFAVIIITLIFYGIIYYFSISQTKLSSYFMGGALVVILINVFIPHVIAKIVVGQYAPGVITGIIFNLPATLYLLNRGIRENIYNFRTLIKSGIALSLIMLLLLQLLFSIGRITASVCRVF